MAQTMRRLSIFNSCIIALAMISSIESIKFAPYYDTTLPKNLGTPNLVEISARTGQKDFTLAFALGGHSGCQPMWGAQFDIDDPEIVDSIKAVVAQGGQMIVASGGAAGPYLEHVCSSVDDLVAAYKKALDSVGSNHIDVDVEASVPLDLMNRALAKLQSDRPDVTVGFTLMIQGEDYGMTDILGVEILRNAVQNNLRVDVVNAMTMEFPKISESWADSIINASLRVLDQMKGIWPSKPDSELRSMLGITPMLGRNFNGNVFEIAHARTVVNWAKQNQIGFLAFWSVGRDNGNCAGGSLSPTCSGIPQGEYEFTSIFRGFVN